MELALSVIGQMASSLYVLDLLGLGTEFEAGGPRRSFSSLLLGPL